MTQNVFIDSILCTHSLFAKLKGDKRAREREREGGRRKKMSENLLAHGLGECVSGCGVR